MDEKDFISDTSDDMSDRVDANPAVKTMGKPATGPNMVDIIANRRRLSKQPKLSPKGELFLKKVRGWFFRKFNGLKIDFKWDIKCGCTMCPCSPGFKIFAIKDDKSRQLFDYNYRIRENDRFDIWSDDKDIDARLKRSLASSGWLLVADERQSKTFF